MEHKNLAFLSIVALLLVAGLAGCGGAPKVDWELNITGTVSTPLTLSYSDLAAMDQVDLSDVLMEKSLGEDVVTSWSGVPLEEILNQAGASANYVSVTALAADGYAIEISRDELQGAIVALKTSDEWIVNAAEEEGKGPIRLVCPETPANRWVFQLEEIQVNE
jgi:DMSO/TMAO reductase YedYZ molybdopterin-dependent catalytic subunit